jgi:hypothetical protein
MRSPQIIYIAASSRNRSHHPIHWDFIAIIAAVHSQDTPLKIGYDSLKLA